MVGGGCFPHLYAVDDLVGQTILAYLTVTDALHTASTCRGAAALGACDVAVIAGLRFKYLE